VAYVESARAPATLERVGVDTAFGKQFFALDLDAGTAGRYLARLADAGRIRRIGRGRYIKAALPPPVLSVPLSQANGTTRHNGQPP